ncbi:Crossover junction endonuclease mus81 [Vanrija albida]|uniref:Crossover junction endonuclease MUS81 n=1 Tax=Vanrija albida TaxID=181172 RepID=A0ABR3Q8N7_9TREE
MPPPPARCANPLFLQWLEELRDAAREKGLKTSDVYSKACRSLAACPVPYDRPRELAQLQGIGPKTVALLEARLKKHCEETGALYPASPARARARPAAQPDDEEAAPPPKKRKATKPKAYIPQRGSGAYGLLLGLLLAIDDPGNIQNWMTKGELTRAAQAYCDSSYDHSERGGYATAWNGMKTLVGKGYALVMGSPHRYCLTEDGYDVAVTLRNMHPEFEGQPKLLPLAREREPSPAASEATARAPSPPPAPARSGKFGFWYIDARGRRVDSIDDAKLRLCPDEYIALRQIEFRESQRAHPISAQLRLVAEVASVAADGVATLSAFIVEDGAPPICSRFDEVAPAASSTSARPASTSRAAPMPMAKAASTSALGAGSNAPPQAPRLGPTRSAPRLSSQLPRLGEIREAPSFSPSDAIVFPHGSYEVVLILDTREVESRSNRDKIATALAAKGVKVETRALRMGDMCWIARRLDGTTREEDECVLDFVVERKRLDDLCSSILDGRYHEQCFRLSQSGIGKVFYVVEDFQLAERMEFHGAKIMTAKSQIQVINGFFLKETHKLNDTIDFLATMTSVIQQTHRDLEVIPPRFISRTSYSSLQASLRQTYLGKTFLTSFESYQALNDKSGSRTVYETLARMLLCVKGMSPERVAAVLDQWDTPLALYEAMKRRHAEGTRTEGRKTRTPQMMFADQVAGEGRRKIGDAQSAVLWKALWGDEA